MYLRYTVYWVTVIKWEYKGKKKKKQPKLLKVRLQHNTKNKHCMNIGLLKHGFRLTDSWGLKKMLEVSTLSLHVDRILGPYFPPPCPTGAVYHDFIPTAFQSCCKLLLCRLGFIYGPCMMVLLQMSLQFGNSWTTRFHNNGQREVNEQLGLHVSLVHISYISVCRDIRSLLFVPQKSLTSGTCNN
jgi:hypothetical protein